MTALNTQSDEYFFVERFARFDPDEVLILKYLRKQTISLLAAMIERYQVEGKKNANKLSTDLEEVPRKTARSKRQSLYGISHGFVSSSKSTMIRFFDCNGRERKEETFFGRVNKTVQ
jgi:hypothetical protein